MSGHSLFLFGKMMESDFIYGILSASLLLLGDTLLDTFKPFRQVSSLDFFCFQEYLGKIVGKRFGGGVGGVYLCAPLLKQGRISSLSLWYSVVRCCFGWVFLGKKLEIKFG